MNEFEELLGRYLQNLIYKENTETGGKKQYSGYIEGEKQYNSFMTDLKALGFLFSTENSNQNKSSRIVFSFEQKRAEIRIPYFGSPFQVVKSIYMACSQGGSSEPKKPPKPLMSEHPLSKRPRTRNKLSKKTGCPAVMTIKCLRVFTDDCYKPAGAYKRGSTENARIMERLNRDLREACPPPAATLRYLLLLSPAVEHNHTVESPHLNHRIDPRLKAEIQEYARLNDRSAVPAVREHLHNTVGEMFGGGLRPHATNRCYYPVDKVIRFHMNAATASAAHARDRTALETLVADRSVRSPGDALFYRPETLLFAHQTALQRHLLRRYGDQVASLDPAYKTCGYAFPLYLITVKTNAGELVAGTFIVQRETAVLVEEALSHFKAWNPDWEPQYLLTDNSEANLTALERSFPQAAIYVCPFHREQAWERWLNKKGNVRKKAVGPTLALWRSIASSPTDEALAISLATAQADTDERALRYLRDEWLPLQRAWVDAYRAQDLAWRLAVGSGVAGLYEARLDGGRRGEDTMAGVVGDVVDRRLPAEAERYAAANIPLDCREYNVAVPEFLRDRPVPFIEAVAPAYEHARLLCDPSCVTETGDGLFLVRDGSEPASEWRSVDLRIPECSCEAFSLTRLPCVHVCAVLAHTGRGLDSLPDAYTQHAYLVNDDEIPGETADAIAVAETEETEEVGEEIDIGTLMEVTRDKLRAMSSYTYLQYDPVAAIRFAEAISALEGAMSDEAHRTVKGLSLGPNDCVVPVVAKRYLPVKTGKTVEYFALNEAADEG